MDLAKPSEKSQEAAAAAAAVKESAVSLLLRNVPALAKLFTIRAKVGEGSFSTVFLGLTRSSVCGRARRSYAIKHLVPTCHPSRIERELHCLKNIGGQDHVAGLELCLRNAGSVVFVMPFMEHQDFSEYVYKMDTNELKDYMKALLTALCRVHSFNIIHRDIKPSNFLYNRKNRRYLLVDFGLAQQYIPHQSGDINSKTEQTNSQLVKRKRSDENKIDTTLKSANIMTMDKCYCFGKPKVCSICLIRPVQTAARAGTPGYRAPEVLLKHPSQTPAIDIWASGVIMLSMLSETHPFFRSPDDMTALAEITSVFGSTAMQQCARNLGKKLMLSLDIPGIDLKTLCLKLRQRNRSKLTSFQQINKNYPEEAFDLLKRLLDLDYKTRITAEEALLHPFFKT